MEEIQVLKATPSDGRFQKGVSGNLKGKAKGTLSKKNRMLDDFAAKAVTGGMPKFLKEMKTLEGKQYTDCFLALFEFTRGKITRQEISTLDGEGMAVKQVFIIGGKELTF